MWCSFVGLSNHSRMKQTREGGHHVHLSPIKNVNLPGKILNIKDSSIVVATSLFYTWKYIFYLELRNNYVHNVIICEIEITLTCCLVELCFAVTAFVLQSICRIEFLECLDVSKNYICFSTKTRSKQST